MWLFTKMGFYSLVEHNQDPSAVLVRSRAREDLERLADAMGLSHDLIEYSAAADYAWRLGSNAEIAKSDVVEIFDTFMSDLTYTSHVKEETSSPSGARENDRYSWYMSAWSRGLDFQDKRLGREPVRWGYPTASNQLSFGREERDWSAELDQASSDENDELSEWQEGEDLLSFTEIQEYFQWCVARDSDPSDETAFNQFLDEFWT